MLVERSSLCGVTRRTPATSHFTYSVLPVSPRGHEVQTAVDAVVLHMPPVQAALVGEVLPELLVDVRRAHAPRVLAVDGVPKPGRVHYR